MKKLTAVTLLVFAAIVAAFNIVAASDSKTVFTTQLGDSGATGSDAHGEAVFIFSMITAR